MTETNETGPHPVVYVGIGIFVIPLALNMLHIKAPGWINTVGILTILVGVGLTAYTKHKK